MSLSVLKQLIYKKCTCHFSLIQIIDIAPVLNNCHLKALYRKVHLNSIRHTFKSVQKFNKNFGVFKEQLNPK